MKRKKPDATARLSDSQQRMKPRFVPPKEFSIKTSLAEIALVMPRSRFSGPEVLTGVWLKAGVSEEDVVEYSDNRTFQASVYFSARREAERILRHLDIPRQSRIRVVKKFLKSADWLAAWKKNIKPFRLTKTFDVVPAWTVPARKKRKNSSGTSRGRRKILLDTTMAFGTGLHETTRFMAVLIESRAGGFKTFLDVGTGSGLLSIVASYGGAKQVDAIDIDQHCLTVAKQNLARNGFAFRRCYKGDFLTHSARRQYDFVAANLFTRDLLAMRDQLFRRVKPGKFLAVSGIALENLSALKKSFGSLPLRCRRVERGKKWAAVLYQRKE